MRFEEEMKCRDWWDRIEAKRSGWRLRHGFRGDWWRHQFCLSKKRNTVEASGWRIKICIDQVPSKHTQTTKPPRRIMKRTSSTKSTRHFTILGTESRHKNKAELAGPCLRMPLHKSCAKLPMLTGSNSRRHFSWWTSYWKFLMVRKVNQHLKRKKVILLGIKP